MWQNRAKQNTAWTQMQHAALMPTTDNPPKEVGESIDSQKGEEKTRQIFSFENNTSHMQNFQAWNNTSYLTNRRYSYWIFKNQRAVALLCMPGAKKGAYRREIQISIALDLLRRTRWAVIFTSFDMPPPPTQQWLYCVRVILEITIQQNYQSV